MKVFVDGTGYDFDANRLMASEARLIKQHMNGMTLPDWQKAMNDTDPDALTVLVLILRRRAGEKDLAFDDVDFDMGSLKVEGAPTTGPTRRPAGRARSSSKPKSSATS